jgi:hypothetical protein
MAPQALVASEIPRIEERMEVLMASTSQGVVRARSPTGFRIPGAVHGFHKCGAKSAVAQMHLPRIPANRSPTKRRRPALQASCGSRQDRICTQLCARVFRLHAPRIFTHNQAPGTGKHTTLLRSPSRLNSPSFSSLRRNLLARSRLIWPRSSASPRAIFPCFCAHSRIIPSHRMALNPACRTY